MSARDLKVIRNAGETFPFNVDDRDTSGASAVFEPGEPVKIGGAGNNFIILLATGDPEIAVDIFVGVGRRQSNELAASDGVMDVITLLPNTMIRAFATTPGNMNTAAELLGIRNDYVTFDLTGAVFTIDENEGDDPNVHGLKIKGGDIVRGTLDVIPHINVTESGPLIGQTMD